jgi:hypothetical protein
VNFRPFVSAHPAAINVHIYINVTFALDVYCDVGSRNRLSQSRCRRDGRKERDRYFERRGFGVNAIGKVGRGGIIVIS